MIGVTFETLRSVLQEVIVGITKTDIQAFHEQLKVTYITKNLDKLHD
jgi:hypothetical protein